MHRFADPDCRLYRAFGLNRGNFRQVLGWAVWKRGLRAALVEGHGLGRLAGDGFQLCGAFLIEAGRIVSAFRARPRPTGRITWRWPSGRVFLTPRPRLAAWETCSGNWPAWPSAYPGRREGRPPQLPTSLSRTLA